MKLGIFLLGGLIILSLSGVPVYAEMPLDYVYHHRSIAIEAKIGAVNTFADEASAKRRAGLLGGLGIKKPILSFLSVTGSILYSQHQFNYKNEIFNQSYYRSHNLTFPITVRLNNPGYYAGPFLGLGIEPIITLSGFTKEADPYYNEYIQTEFQDELQPFNFGLVAEGGIEFHAPFGTVVMYTMFTYYLKPEIKQFPLTNDSVGLFQLSFILCYQYDIVFIQPKPGSNIQNKEK